MPTPTGWWWIRHAPVPGADARIVGRLDLDCDTGDRESFRALASLLPADAVCLVTPLARTRQTFDALVAAGAPLAGPVPEDDLIEQGFGDWDGLGWAEMQARDPEVYRAFWRDPTGNAPPAGESFAAQMRRVAAAVERLTARFAGREIVAVAHGGTIRAAIGHALALPPERAMSVVVDNLSLSRLTYVPDGLLGAAGGAWRVHGINMPCRWIPAARAC